MISGSNQRFKHLITLFGIICTIYIFSFTTSFTTRPDRVRFSPAGATGGVDGWAGVAGSFVGTLAGASCDLLSGGVQSPCLERKRMWMLPGLGGIE